MLQIPNCVYIFVFFSLKGPLWSAGLPAWWFCCWTDSTARVVTSQKQNAGCYCWLYSTLSWTLASTPTRTRKCGQPSRTSCAALATARGGSGRRRPTPGLSARVRIRATVSLHRRRQKLTIRAFSRPENGAWHELTRTSVLSNDWTYYEDSDWSWLETITVGLRRPVLSSDKNDFLEVTLQAHCSSVL